MSRLANDNCDRPSNPSIGLLFPWLLYGAGKDLAFGSGPVATIVQDVLSLLIYFTIVQWLVV